MCKMWIFRGVISSFLCISLLHLFTWKNKTPPHHHLFTNVIPVAWRHSTTQLRPSWISLESKTLRNMVNQNLHYLGWLLVNTGNFIVVFYCLSQNHVVLGQPIIYVGLLEWFLEERYNDNVARSLFYWKNSRWRHLERRLGASGRQAAIAIGITNISSFSRVINIKHC